MQFDTNTLSTLATEARGIAIDGVVAAGYVGHLGMPLGAAEIGAVTYGYGLKVDPAKPRWINRDRFVLSAGHGSMFLYGWLHLAGFDVTKEDLSKFRHLHSKTPGHPEYGYTDGIEATTGPLGQGVGNSVGLAVSGKMAESFFNTEEHAIFDYNVFCLAGDGCLQEGVAREAVAFAGHQKLDNLILIYDSNDVTLDAMGEASQSENTQHVYEALGWEVLVVDGHDLDALKAAIDYARVAKNGKPKLIEAKTEIGRGIPEVAGTSGAHGEGGAKFAEASINALGLPGDPFYVSEESKAYLDSLKAERASASAAWDALYADWKAANAELAQTLEDGYANKLPSFDELSALVSANEKAAATRASAGAALSALAAKLPLVVSGSADLHGSTKNYLKEADGDFMPDNRKGRNILFGIREHAMGAIVNGIAYEGLFYASGATFFTFSDYMRPSVRLSALSHINSLWYWTHDSVGVGVDGPTHQPVETMASLRVMPQLSMIKPGDPEESVGAIIAGLLRTDGPTGLSLSRQNLPLIETVPAEERRKGVLKGGYIIKKEAGELTHIIISCGSELSLAVEAAEALGDGVRVVSMPSTFLFDQQDAAYQESILPASCTKRVAVEAGVPDSWYKYVGFAGKIVGFTRFGLSAPGDQILNELGITKDAVIEAAKSL
ncbi:MAG: transketolase [Opitutales bacterium]|nr:transketolase [Opitutales bacterium]NRA27014.1 transketolase [Opitutales bacterium]